MIRNVQETVLIFTMNKTISYQKRKIVKEKFPLTHRFKMPYIIDDKSLPIKAAGNLSVC